MLNKMSFTVFFILVLFLCSCNTNNTKEFKYTYTLGEESKIVESQVQRDGEVTIELSKNKYRQEDSIQYTITNKSNSDLFIASDNTSFLEKQDKGIWRKVIFNLIEPIHQGDNLLPVNKSIEITTLTINQWLDQGTFRIVRHLNDSPEQKGNPILLVSQPFTVT